MSRIGRSIGALLLAVVVCAGASAGPAFGDTSPPAEPTATEPAATEPAVTEPAVTEPVAAEPVAPGPAAPEPTTEPVETPTPVQPDLPADPVAVEPTEESVDLTISVVFDKPVFLADEAVTARARVTNAGTASASRVRLSSTGNLTGDTWTVFGYGGVPIEPGQTVEGTLSEYVTTADELLTLGVTAHSAEEPDANPANNTVTATVPITVVRGGYRGTVYADRNGNAADDPGEEFGGLAVTVAGNRPNATYTTTTDPAGRFEFQGLPRGRYAIWFGEPDWAFRTTDVDVDGVDDPDLVFRGVHPIAMRLTASAAFARDGYQVNDEARLVLTLTNSSPVPIPGITASCWSLVLDQFDLGELAPAGPGATVPANANRAFDVPILLDGRVGDHGYLAVTCRFGAPFDFNPGPIVEVTTRVRGARAASVGGRVAQFYLPGHFSTLGMPRPGPPVPNLKVYLKDQFTGAVFARATTDATGAFEFRDVPAGVHQFGLVGPWRIVIGGPSFTVRASDVPGGGSHLVLVVPSSDQPDPDPVPPQPGEPSVPVQPPAAGPAGQPAAAGLAATGANVTWLALGGLLTLLGGIGLSARTRRRRI